MKVVNAHSNLRDRILFVQTFRKNHEQLVQTIERVQKFELDSSKSKRTDIWCGILKNVKKAIEPINSVDALDISSEGTELWQMHENQYNEKISKVEQFIISRLKDQLGTCDTATDMFRCFSRFNALFVRPKIRAAIHEYQTLLIERVKEDIKKLHSKFTSGNHSHTMISCRDIPPISSAIIWARQINRKLALYMKRVEDVLGKGWDHYAEGQKLHQEDVAFSKQLDTQHIFTAWLNEVQAKYLGIKGPLFAITQSRQTYQLSVNFDATLISLFKEVRNLLHLNFQIPHSILTLAKEAQKIYPFAVALIETIRTYQKTLHIVQETLKNDKILVSTLHYNVQQLLSQGMKMQWDYFMTSLDYSADNSHVTFVYELASHTLSFQDKVTICAERLASISALIQSISTISYVKSEFENIIQAIQKVVDSFHYDGYSQIEKWVSILDARIEKKLLERLTGAIKVWLSGEPIKRLRSVHKSQLCIRNNSLFLDPPLENARMIWMNQLHDFLDIILSLPRIKLFQYERPVQHKTLKYHNIIQMLDIEEYKACYTLIDDYYLEVSKYVGEWLHYQALWDVEPNSVFEKLNSDLELWQKVIVQIKKQRITFDTSKTSKSFDGIEIDFESVQQKVNAKYDQWQRDLLLKYGSITLIESKTFLEDVRNARQSLELNIGPLSSDMINFILNFRSLKASKVHWEIKLEKLYKGQKILDRHRFHYPTDWIHIDHLRGEWGSFTGSANLII